MKTLLNILLIVFVTISVNAQKTVVYNLHVSDTVVNYTGKTVKGIAINGSIPAPTLYFTEGDTAVIYVHNMMHHETSIHWHGLILPNEQDGVPYLTTTPIKGMSTHTYKFPIKQSGTYWYHSHTMLQEQSGLYGAFIIHKKTEPKIPEYTMLLSDWSDEKPEQIERSLHYATDWYAIKKGATQNYAQAIANGHLKTKLANEWKRMHAMDVSDVYYERFLINGKTEVQTPLKKGEKIRLRIINGSASTYFWINYAGGKMKVVASDGSDVEPFEVDRFIIATSETYDVIVTIPDNTTAYELTATSEDRIGHVSLWIGNGVKQLANPLPRLKYFEGMKMMNGMMNLNGSMDDMGMDMSLQQMDMNSVMYPEIIGNAKTEEHSQHNHQMKSGNLVTLNYAMLKATKKTTLPNTPIRTLYFELTGNMNRYVWTINNKTVSETDKILIKAGENIRIIMTNNSMMRHPMHLHGHYFRVLNGQGAYSPLKNVIDIMPMETDTLEFNASESYGDWFFHCHILYHMMSGMGRIFTYENSPPNPQIPNPEKALKKVYHDDKRFYLGAEIGLESNGSDGGLIASNTRWYAQTEWRLGINNRLGYESESHIGRYLGKMQFLSAYTGWDYRYRDEDPETERNMFGQLNTKNSRGVICLGLQYTLPWFIVADFRVDHTGKLRLQVGRDDIPLTARLRLWAYYNSDFEYSIGTRYILTKYISLSTHYDSDMGIGGGLVINY